MCMGNCGGGSPKPKSNSYTPKKFSSNGKASKGSYTPRTSRAVMGGFGKPSISAMSFSGRKR